ncbi:MAG: enoyl-CoA hydratase/isomerase family protein [Deltaproteobacteria bacterium]|nr:MAG: enoyl-CoA hydratase/isomerase family protein [Deltaproteobacteria bacterium]
MVSYQHIEVRVDGAIGELRLNRPADRNAMSPEMGEEIVQAVAELNGHDELRSVLIVGAGKCFSSGGDFALLDRLAGSRPDDGRRTMRTFYGNYLAIRELRVPTIALIHGHALGAGLCFALGCDIRLAAEGTKVGMTFVRVGLHPGMGATFLLSRAVGAARAAELLLTGRVIGAQQALDMGLVSQVVPPAELEATGRVVAEEIALCAPIAVAQLKATLRDDGHRSLGEALDREAACQAIDYATADMAEAIAAFRGKRPPAYQGK